MRAAHDTARPDRAGRLRALIAGVALAAAAALPAAAQDRYENYYYPPVGSEETFARKIIPGPVPDANAREAFVTLITRAQLDAPDSPPYVLFAKGEASRKLILVGLDDQMFGSIYRARAVMAQLSASMRGAPFFREQGLQATGTFYDMLQLLDFKSLTITDGESWAHRVNFE